MSKLNIIKSREYNGAQYLTLMNEHEVQQCISTEAIHIEKLNPEDDNTITFTITEAMCKKLFIDVINLETQLVKTIQCMEPVHFDNLPLHCSSVIKENYNNCNAVIRPNYFKLNENTMFLKGNFVNMKMFDWSGKKELMKKQLGPGEYKFWIRASMVYIGPHKNPLHIANLQLRICELCYRPFPMKGNPIIKAKRVNKRQEQPIQHTTEDELSQSKNVFDCDVIEA